MKNTSSTDDIAALDRISREVRHKLIEISGWAKSAHLAGSLSCVDLLVALYWTTLRVDGANPEDPDRDRLIFSKGKSTGSYWIVGDGKGPDFG